MSIFSRKYPEKPISYGYIRLLCRGILVFMTEQNTSVSPMGLTSSEVDSRLAVFGPNTIYQKKRLQPLIEFLNKFKSPLLVMLMIAATISFFIEGQRISGALILLMVFLSAILDFVNTHKSEKVAETLVARVASTATVFRDGQKQEVAFSSLVPGDIAELVAGDVIPADGRVLSADDFFVNQSALTGESFPVEKEIGSGAPALLKEGESLSLSDPTAVFMGTSVVTGYATIMILQTGPRAEFGKIAARLQAKEEETSFDRGLREFSLFIMKLTFIMVIIVFFVNAFFGRGVFDSFIFAIAIAVGLTPELLPVIMSVALSHGSLVMAKKHVIVKNLGAVQNFGGMNILCTDKTGTLTEDKIKLVKCVDPDGQESALVMQYAYLNSIFHTARRSPLDTAIQEHGQIDAASYTKVDEIPFDFERRRDSLVLQKGEERLIVTKGAPESIIEVCAQVGDRAMTEELRTQLRATYDALSSDGFRVLGIATKSLSNESRTEYSKTEEQDMVFNGFAAFLDPPKQSVIQTLLELKELHIEVKILTGDSEVLTERICRDIGLPVTKVLTGADLEHLSDSELTVLVGQVNVFARVSPEQKERIVSLLRKAGNVVGYLGDGINDAPVLKAADVGISVNNAVDVAKETADIILLSKSLSVLKDGIVEGRKTFLNTLKYIKMGFSSNFGNMFSMMGASAVLPFLPMLPTQILLNNFLYDLSQTTLPTDHTDPESTKKPLSWDMKGFSKYIIVFGIVSSVFDFFMFYLLYAVFDMKDSAFQTGWFIESIATQVLIIFVIRTKRVPFFRSMPSVYIMMNAAFIVGLAWILPFTMVGGWLHLVPLPLPILGAIVGVVLVYLCVGEVVKYFFYRWRPTAP